MTRSITLPAFAHRIITRALDLVLPPRCLSCGTEVSETGALCPTCWHGVAWIAPPLCAICGLPFEFDPGLSGASDRLVCGSCARRRPAFDRARAVFRYDDSSKRLVLGFKHADRTHAAPAFGRWLERAGVELLQDADLVAPVPLHWTRLALRRYNQAALLAHASARAARSPCVADLLVRIRRTPTQGALGRSARWRNVSRAFAVNPRHLARVKGARVLLIDDVLTTGATVNSCTRTLRAAGARGVDVLTLARVVRPETA